MGLVLVTPNESEPLTLEEAKAHLRVDDTSDDEDTYIEGLIEAARDYAEQNTGRALLPQSWLYTADYFPACNGVIRLYRVPLISVESLQYVDTNGNLTTLPANQYIVDTTSKYGDIAPAYGVSWPYARAQRNAVQVSFTAGYADATLVPRGIRNAMLLFIGDLYANREASVDGLRANENPRVDDLLQGHSILHV